MKEILTYAQCLNRLIQQHGYSQQHLCTVWGCLRADLRRVLAETATEKKRNQLHQSILNSGLFSDEECSHLQHALQVSQIGLENYHFCCSLEKILSGQFQYTGPQIKINDHLTLEHRLAFLEAAEYIDIICVNCCFPSLAHALLPLFSDQNRSIRMRHFIHADERSHLAASYLSSFFPLLFDNRYLPYGMDLDASADIHPLGGNLLVVQAKLGFHLHQFFFGVRNSEIVYEMANANAADSFGFVEMLLGTLSPAPFPLKVSSDHHGDFSSLCMSFLSYELNRATYSISNTISFHQIPTAIALAALHGKEVLGEKQLQELTKRAAIIHEQRYHNQYYKKKYAYRIMTIAGCRSFLRTGKISDHFFAFRAFTPEERKLIFADVIRHAKENAYFVPLLVKDPERSIRYNLVACDKLGVVVDASDTDYNLANGYHTVLLTFPEFTRLYMEHYLGCVTSQKCYSREESLRMLEEMYRDFLTEYSLTDETA